METKEDLLLFLRTNKAELTRRFDLVKIGVFGSFADDTQSESSDIDLIVEFKPNTSNLSEKKSGLRKFIKETFNREVDICREKYLKPYFRNLITNSAIYV